MTSPRWLATALLISATASADPEPAELDPFGYADWTWLSGNPRTKYSKLGNEYFTGEFRADDVFHYSLNRPADDTIGGSTEAWRHGENQVTQLGIGGDFHVDRAQGRLMTQFGQISTTTPRNDASPARGQWQLADAYRYVSEAYGGYHIDAMHGINVQAGIFMSYVGLWSYYNFDNWTYQPSYVSSNTPWFFNGMRVQFFPSDKLKIEPWLVNGWQSYGRLNTQQGVGAQFQWRPSRAFSVLGNQYYGADTFGVPRRRRVHTDDSIMGKYVDRGARAGHGLDKAAASLTFDAGGETGGGVTMKEQYFVGFMAYNRLWFDHDRYGLTVGGGGIRNPGRYLVLLPPINGATAFSGSPYFTENPGDKYAAWDTQVTFDWMPRPYVTFRAEYNHRQANVPYFAGHGGLTPPGGNTGDPASLVPNWSPDLVKVENRITLALLVKV